MASRIFESAELLYSFPACCGSALFSHVCVAPKPWVTHMGDHSEGKEEKKRRQAERGKRTQAKKRQEGRKRGEEKKKKGEKEKPRKRETSKRGTDETRNRGNEQNGKEE